MDVRISQHPPTQLAGISRQMSLADNQTAALWRQFMPLRHTITQRQGDSLYSLQVYNPEDGNLFDPHTRFTKWALVPVTHAENLPEPMQPFELEGGQYAVFTYVGPASDAARVFGYIFGQWLPNSPYQLDARPHFEILPLDYHPAALDATEEIWIPIRPR